MVIPLCINLNDKWAWLTLRDGGLSQSPVVHVGLSKAWREVAHPYSEALPHPRCACSAEAKWDSVLPAPALGGAPLVQQHRPKRLSARLGQPGRAEAGAFSVRQTDRRFGAS